MESKNRKTKFLIARVPEMFKELFDKKAKGLGRKSSDILRELAEKFVNGK